MDRDPPDPTSAGADDRAAPDWAAAAVFLRMRLRRSLPRVQAADIEDLVQEALIDLVRAHRHEPIRNLEALLVTLARRKAVDLVRRRERWRRIVQPMPEEGENGLADRVRDTDPAARLAFLAVQFFAREGSPCESLARAYLAGHDWSEVAASEGLAEAAVRKRWSRCVAHLRRTLAHAPPGWIPE